MSIWTIIDEIATHLHAAKDGKVDATVDAMLSALSETIADALPTANQTVLSEGALALRRALDAAGEVDEASATFAAGQLAAAADLLGFAAGRAASDEAVALAARPTHSALLAALTKDARSNGYLQKALGGVTDAYVCRLLKELRTASLVTTQKRGREAFNTLTPVGRLLAASQALAQAPKIQLPVTIDMSQFNYMLNAIPVANDFGSEIPRLQVAH